MSFNQKETLEQFYVGEFATPKKLNRSEKKIPASIIQSLENGDFTTEMINDLSKKFPIFVYRSCITIHGSFGDITTTSIGGYQNVRQNENGSVEILYSAIDLLKVKRLDKLTRVAGTQIRTTSKGHGFQRSFETLESIKTFLTAIKGAKGVLFGVFAFKFMGTYYADISLLSIKETAIIPFAELVCEMSLSEIEAKQELNRLKAIERQKAYEAKDKEDEAQTDTYKAQIEHLPKATTFTEGQIYVKVLNYSSRPFEYTYYEKVSQHRMSTKYYKYELQSETPISQPQKDDFRRSYDKCNACIYDKRVVSKN